MRKLNVKLAPLVVTVKMILKNLTAFILFTALSMVVFVDSAQCADDATPLEVKALVGMRIPDTGTARDDFIPGWAMNGFETFYISPDKMLMQSMVMFDQNDLSIFAIVLRSEKEKNTTILDAQVLPIDLLTHYIKNGKAVTKKQWWKFYVPTVHCYRKRGETIVGLMRPERGKQDCSHKTKQVNRAWKIDQESGHISEIAHQGVSCSYMGGEYSCDPE